MEDTPGFKQQVRLGYTIYLLCFLAFGMAFSAGAASVSARVAQSNAEYWYDEITAVKGRLAALISRSPAFFHEYLFSAATGITAACSGIENGPCRQRPFQMLGNRTSADGTFRLGVVSGDYDLATAIYNAAEEVGSTTAASFQERGSIDLEELNALIASRFPANVGIPSKILEPLAELGSADWSYSAEWATYGALDALTSGFGGGYARIGYDAGASHADRYERVHSQLIHIYYTMQTRPLIEAAREIDREWIDAFKATVAPPEVVRVGLFGADLGFNRLEYVIATTVAITALFVLWAAFVVADQQPLIGSALNAAYLFPHFGRYIGPALARGSDKGVRVIRAVTWWSFLAFPALLLSYGIVTRYSPFWESYMADGALRAILIGFDPEGFSMAFDAVNLLCLATYLSVAIWLDARFTRRNGSFIHGLVATVTSALAAASLALQLSRLSGGVLGSDTYWSAAAVHVTFLAICSASMFAASWHRLTGIMSITGFVLLSYSLLAT